MGVQHLLCAAVRSAVRLIILFAQNGQCDGRQRRRDHKAQQKGGCARAEIKDASQAAAALPRRHQIHCNIIFFDKHILFLLFPAVVSLHSCNRGTLLQS